MAYQKNREEVLKSAIVKRGEALRLRQKENWNRIKDEEDAIDYFCRIGFYRTHPDPSMSPNIFDSRKSFLIKMQHNKKFY